MRKAYGKAYGKACRVKIGDILVSIRCKKEHIKIVLEGLRRGKNKLPGRQKFAVSQNYGFTNYTHQEIADAKENGTLISKGNHAIIENKRGRLDDSIMCKKLQTLVNQMEQEDD